MIPFAVLASLFLSAASAGVNSMAARKQQRARDDVLEAERIRQRGYDKETGELNTQSQDRYQDYSGKQAVKAQDLGDYFSAQTQSGPNESAGAIMPSASSDVVNNEIARQSGEAAAYTGQQAGALADLRSFGDLLGDTSLLQARDASKIGQIGGFKRGSADIVPYELEAAMQKGGGMRTFADILNGIGGIAGGMGGGAKPQGVLPGGAPLGQGGIGSDARFGPLASLYGGGIGSDRVASLYPRRR